MRWFKHYSDASAGESLSIVFDLAGHMGLSCYWLLLEDCARTWKPENLEPVFKRTLKHYRNLFRTKQKCVDNLLRTYQECGLIEISVSGEIITIKIPKLLEIRDNHKKNLQAKDKQLAKGLPPKRKEVKRESYKKKPSVSSPEPKPSASHPVEEELKKFSSDLLPIDRVHPDTQKGWVEDYSPEYLAMEFRGMHTWLRDNPKKARKSRWGMWVGGWLKRGWEKHLNTLQSNPRSSQGGAAVDISKYFKENQ